MRKLLEDLLKEDRYKVEIPGLNDRLGDQYKYVYATSEDDAVRKIVARIARDVDRGKIAHKAWEYKGWVVTQKNIGGLVQAVQGENIKVEKV